MQQTMLLSARGHDASVELYPDRIFIKGVNHEFQVFLKRVSAILFIHATGIVPGSIEFFFGGDALLQHKFNLVSFSKDQEPEFVKIKEGIEDLILQLE